MATCDLCHEDKERVDRSVGSYVCARCVQVLCNSPQDSLQRAYDLAIKHGYNDKARAIQSFLEVGDEPVKPNKHNGHIDRAGITRPVRNEKVGLERFKA